jgi:hypothetical protein
LSKRRRASLANTGAGEAHYAANITLQWTSTIACAILTAAIVSVTGAGAAESSYPRPLKACGSIVIGAKTIAVDIPEHGGGAMVSCATARNVMTSYLERARSRRWPRGSGRNLDFAYRRLHFSCYTSRPDRVGWDFHCGTDDFSGGSNKYVDVGAGRRGKLCRLPYAQSRRCPPG